MPSLSCAFSLRVSVHAVRRSRGGCLTRSSAAPASAHSLRRPPRYSAVRNACGRSRCALLPSRTPAIDGAPPTSDATPQRPSPCLCARCSRQRLCSYRCASRSWTTPPLKTLLGAARPRASATGQIGHLYLFAALPAGSIYCDPLIAFALAASRASTVFGSDITPQPRLACAVPDRQRPRIRVRRGLGGGKAVRAG